MEFYNLHKSRKKSVWHIGRSQQNVPHIITRPNLLVCFEVFELSLHGVSLRETQSYQSSQSSNANDCRKDGH